MSSILFFLFLIIIGIQVGYYGILFTPFSFAKKQDILASEHPVSVIIACKNEENNLRKNLPKILSQIYAKFEIVLIDDASTDDTLSVMRGFAKQHDTIKILSIPKSKTYTGNKKNALSQAIQKAKYEHLLFTDADCYPVSKSWIAEMATSFTVKKQLILGYGAYKKKPGYFNKLIRYETLLTAWQYLSYALVGLPYMGVGRNIAYTKMLFKKSKGFQSHQDIQSGDDDLFVNQVGTVDNISICWKPSAHTLSKPKTNIQDWIRQKRRHVTTAVFYKPIHQFLLGTFYVSQLLFYSLFFLLLFTYNNPKIILLLAGIRFLVFYFSLIPSAKKLKEKDLILCAPLLEIFLISMQIRIFIENLWEKPKGW